MNSLSQLADVITLSLSMKMVQLDSTDGEVFVSSNEWTDFLSKYFKNLDQHFHLEADAAVLFNVFQNMRKSHTPSSNQM